MKYRPALFGPPGYSSLCGSTNCTCRCATSAELEAAHEGHAAASKTKNAKMGNARMDRKKRMTGARAGSWQLDSVYRTEVTANETERSKSNRRFFDSFAAANSLRMTVSGLVVLF